ncbi:hypothetical protein EPUL_005896, partial [Erysiphe pulchra]
MSTDRMPIQELSALKQSGWKLHMVRHQTFSSENNRGKLSTDMSEVGLDQKTAANSGRAKLGVVKAGGKIVEDLAVINGFSLVNFFDSMKTLNEKSAL